MLQGSSRCAVSASRIVHSFHSMSRGRRSEHDGRRTAGFRLYGDLLDQIIAVNERHLHRLIREYVDYYHNDRMRDALEKDTPGHRAVEPKPSAHATVISTAHAGGLHHRYSWATRRRIPRQVIGIVWPRLRCKRRLTPTGVLMALCPGSPPPPAGSTLVAQVTFTPETPRLCGKSPVTQADLLRIRL
jgi:hypothetical protein